MEGTFTRVTGDPAASTIRVTVPLAGLQPDADDLRKATGLPDTLSDSQRAEIREHMMSADQLDGDSHRNMSFSSTSVTGTDSALTVTGDLEIRGKRHSVTVPLALAASGDDLKATGRFEIQQSWFGYEPYSALLGALKVEDGVEVVLDLALVPAG